MNMPSVMEMMEPPDSEVIVKRLLKVAEILTSQAPVLPMRASFQSKTTSKNTKEKKSGIVRIPIT